MACYSQAQRCSTTDVAEVATLLRLAPVESLPAGGIRTICPMRRSSLQELSILGSLSVNVIEDPAERVEAITKAFGLARTVMSIGVMLYSGDPPGKRYRDGFLTSRNTFQKYFSQSELKDYIEQALQRDAFMVGPGVAFVYANAETEQRFSAGRYRRKNAAVRLPTTGAHKPGGANKFREVTTCNSQSLDRRFTPPPPFLMYLMTQFQGDQFAHALSCDASSQVELTTGRTVTEQR